MCKILVMLRVSFLLETLCRMDIMILFESLSMSLLRHNGMLSKQKNEMVSVHQRLKATLEFFTTSLHIDINKYEEQRGTGIGKIHTDASTAKKLGESVYSLSIIKYKFNVFWFTRLDILKKHGMVKKGD